MVTVREARIEDLPALLRIYNWAVRNTTATFDLEEQTLEQRAQWFSHYGGKHPLLVAEEEGRVIGYSSLSKFRDKQAYGRSVESSVYIDHESHGKGVGKLLLAAILQRAEELDYHTVIAGITAGNESSVKLHAKFGFEQVGVFKQVGYKFDAWQDVHFYQLFLPRG
ncbi:MAG: N-acetyltransferase family protein [Tumebacillaceae bacterium]